MAYKTYLVMLSKANFQHLPISKYRRAIEPGDHLCLSYTEY